MNSKYRYLFKNIGLLTISSFSTKLLSFFLVSLYTSVLSASDYGKYDFISSTVGILVPILTLNIYEAVLRYALDNKTSPKIVFSTGCECCAWGNFIVLTLLVLNHWIVISETVNQFS